MSIVVWLMDVKLNSPLVVRHFFQFHFVCWQAWLVCGAAEAQRSMDLAVAEGKTEVWEEFNKAVEQDFQCLLVSRFYSFILLMT